MPSLTGEDLSQKGVATQLTQTFRNLAELNGRQYDTYDEVKARIRAMIEDFQNALEQVATASLSIQSLVLVVHQRQDSTLSFADQEPLNNPNAFQADC